MAIEPLRLTVAPPAAAPAAERRAVLARRSAPYRAASERLLTTLPVAAFCSSIATRATS